MDLLYDLATRGDAGRTRWSGERMRESTYLKQVALQVAVASLDVDNGGA